MLEQKIKRHRFALVLLLGFLLSAIASCNRQTFLKDNRGKIALAASNNRLTEIKKRGHLICGVNGELPGFSFVNAEGKYAGLDVDICRAVAAAIFDDPNKVIFRPLNAKERFSILQAQEIDILSRNTTSTLSRDTAMSLKFLPTTFYDGQGLMVKKNSEIKSLKDLDGKLVCLFTDTNHEQNLSDRLSRDGLAYRPKLIQNGEDLFSAYEYSECDAISADISQLVVNRPILANPQEHIILSEVISKEPLAPVISNEDSQWYDIVKWVMFALIQAEELEIDSQNVGDLLRSKNPEIRRFLGRETQMGSEMGLENNFTARVIKHVGNYGEIYDRNIGKPFSLERGQNALWNQGGLMYSPPFR